VSEEYKKNKGYMPNDVTNSVLAGPRPHP